MKRQPPNIPGERTYSVIDVMPLVQIDNKLNTLVKIQDHLLVSKIVANKMYIQ